MTKMINPCLLKQKQNSCKPSVILVFTMIIVTQIKIIGVQAEETNNQDNYRSISDDKPYDDQRQLSDFMKAQQSTNAFVKETFMDFKNQLEAITKNH